MEALTVIQREHRAIAAVIHCFEQLLRESRTSATDPPVELFALIMAYIRDFSDQFHHPKEDVYLFVALEQRAPEFTNAMAELKHQHAQGMRDTIALQGKLEELKKDPQGAFDEFEKAATDFIESQREHLTFEESKVIPAAREKLKEADWERIDAAFAANDDPIFGAKPRAEFDKLFKQIVATAPEPWGLKSRHELSEHDDTLFRKLRERILSFDWH